MAGQFIPMYYVLEEETERTLTMTTDKAVADFLVANYTVKCFIRVSFLQRQQGDTLRKKEIIMDNKIERLEEIMFEEDEYRDAHGMELIYHTREDFEAEKAEREKQN